MDLTTMEKLTKPFKLKARQGVGGKIFKYVPSDDVVHRMNEVFSGCWSTEIVNKEIIEDTILVCVRVTVTDPETNKIYYHDGYASHFLARYSSGMNNGKIIDVGNSYRSAVSKAIKTACTRWGVGLYLEEEESGMTNHDMSGIQPDIPSSVGNIPTSSSPITNAPPIPTNSVPVTNVPITTQTVVQPNIQIPPQPPIGQNTKMSKPTVGVNTVESSAYSQISNPFTNSPVVSNNTVGNNMPDVPFNGPVVTNHDNTNVVNNDSMVGVGVNNNGEVEKITSVQKAAILKGVCDIYSITYEDLLAKVFPGRTDLPSNIDDLTYFDGIALIQYGNNLRIGKNS